AIGDDVGARALLLLAHRRLQRDRLARGADDLADLVGRGAHLLGDLVRLRLPPELLLQVATYAVHVANQLDHMDRDANRAGLIGDGARHRLSNPPVRIGAKAIALAIVVFLDRALQANV